MFVLRLKPSDYPCGDDDGNKDMTVHFLSLGVGAYTFFYYFLSVLPTICK
jgi:hypothetical protein